MRNIDTLEHRAGVPEHKKAHGSFASQRCVHMTARKCRKEGSVKPAMDRATFARGRLADQLANSSQRGMFHAVHTYLQANYSLLQVWPLTSSKVHVDNTIHTKFPRGRPHARLIENLKYRLFFQTIIVVHVVVVFAKLLKSHETTPDIDYLVVRCLSANSDCACLRKFR